MNILLSVFAVLLVAARLGQAQNYVVDLYLVADNEVVNRYQRELSSTRAVAEAELRKDINYFITEVSNDRRDTLPEDVSLCKTNALLSTLQGLNFKVCIKGIRILNTNIFPASQIISSTFLLGSDAIDTFETWMANQNLQYDAAIFWTGYNLVDFSTSRGTGFSYNGGGCSANQSLAIVEYDGTYQTAVSTAKYIAKIFGAGEDGVAQETINVRYNSPEDADRWSFTSCTADDIRAFIGQLSSNCLLSSSGTCTTPNVTPASYTGRLFDPDVVCQRALNDSSSYMCKAGELYGNQQPGGDNVCQAIFCSVPGEGNLCRPVFTSEGMICSGTQRCNNGICGSGVPSTDACVFGNQQELIIPSVDFQGTCQQLKTQFGNSPCYSTSIQAACCDTCNCGGPAGCECGDRHQACRDFTRAQVCPQNADLCCDYCSGFRRRRSVDDLLPIHLQNMTVEFVEEATYHVVKERIIGKHD